MEYDGFGFCSQYITNDEHILWKGCPEKGNLFTKRDLFMIPFSVMWLGFALFWELSAMQSGGGIFFSLWGLPFIAAGVYMLFGRFIYSAYMRDKTFYVVTNRKIVIKAGRKIKVLDGKNLPPMDIELHKNGNGTIIFSEEYYTRGRRHYTYFMLENLKDVARAENAISSMDR